MVSQDTPVGSLFLCNLCHGTGSPQLLNGHGGANCVINFDEPVKMRSHAGVDGALERIFVTFETEVCAV